MSAALTCGFEDFKGVCRDSAAWVTDSGFDFITCKLLVDASGVSCVGIKLPPRKSKFYDVLFSCDFNASLTLTLWPQLSIYHFLSVLISFSNIW